MFLFAYLQYRYLDTDSRPSFSCCTCLHGTAHAHANLFSPCFRQFPFPSLSMTLLARVSHAINVIIKLVMFQTCHAAQAVIALALLCSINTHFRQHSLTCNQTCVANCAPSTCIFAIPLRKHASLSIILDMQSDMTGPKRKRYPCRVTLGPIFEQLGPRKPNMPVSRVDCGDACNVILVPLSAKWHPSKQQITSSVQALTPTPWCTRT